MMEGGGGKVWRSPQWVIADMQPSDLLSWMCLEGRRRTRQGTPRNIGVVCGACVVGVGVVSLAVVDTSGDERSDSVVETGRHSPKILPKRIPGQCCWDPATRFVLECLPVKCQTQPWSVLAPTRCLLEGQSDDISLRKRHAIELRNDEEIDTDAETATPQTPAPVKESDGYPLFTRYHDSLLRKYLTPQLWSQLRNRRSGTASLDDVIQPGLPLPHCAVPPRGIGVLAGDAQSYKIFAPLFDPIIREYHQLPISKTSHEGNGFVSARRILKRHETLMNPVLITSLNPDPEGEYILSTRMRVARSIEGYPFPMKMSRSQRRQVSEIVEGAVEALKSKEKGGRFIPIVEMNNFIVEDLIRRHILFENPPNEWMISSGLSRDWPDGRGIFVNVNDLDMDSPDVIVWCNEEDHVRLICMSKGSNILGAFEKLCHTIQTMEQSLGERNAKFVRDDHLGYLNSCPSNLGTSLRASVHVRLLRLGKLPGFHDMVQRRLQLDVRGYYGEFDYNYTGIFDISNSIRYGRTEVELVNQLIAGVGWLIQLERALERGDTVDCNAL